jgi:hypothetical protein
VIVEPFYELASHIQIPISSASPTIPLLLDRIVLRLRHFLGCRGAGASKGKEISPKGTI